MKWAGGVVKKWKMGVFFCKSGKWGVLVKKGGKWGVFFCIEVDLFSTQGALCTVGLSVFFLFYILLVWGVRTHPTHPPLTGLTPHSCP